MLQSSEVGAVRGVWRQERSWHVRLSSDFTWHRRRQVHPQGATGQICGETCTVLHSESHVHVHKGGFGIVLQEAPERGRHSLCMAFLHQTPSAVHNGQCPAQRSVVLVAQLSGQERPTLNGVASRVGRQVHPLQHIALARLTPSAPRHAHHATVGVAHTCEAHSHSSQACHSHTAAVGQRLHPVVRHHVRGI